MVLEGRVKKFIVGVSVSLLLFVLTFILAYNLPTYNLPSGGGWVRILFLVGIHVFFIVFFTGLYYLMKAIVSWREE